MQEFRKKTYTIEEAAAMLGIGKTLAYTLVRAGKLPAIKCGGRWIIPMSRFDKWLDGERECG